MKLAYVTILWKPSHGVINRICQISRAFKQIGTNADCILVAPEQVLRQVHQSQELIFRPVSLGYPQRLWAYYRSYNIWQFLADELSKYDALVTRWTVPSPSFLELTKRLPVFTEHHTKEAEELDSKKGISNRLLSYLEKNFGNKILQHCAGIIGMTDEITVYELSRAHKDIPHITIPNGINIDSFVTKERPDYTGGELHILFVSNQFHPWHGLDRVLLGLAKYSGLEPRVVLHIIGKLSSQQKNMITDSGIQQQVQLHGVLDQQDMDTIYSECHIALGSLALHRIHMAQACVLKVREYTARGIPFVIGYDDPDFINGEPWVLQVPADDSPISIMSLIHFAEQISSISNLQMDMRNYAINILTWTQKLKQLVNFVCENSR